MKKKKLKKSLRKRLRKLVTRHGPEVAAILITGFVSDLAASRKSKHRAGDVPDHPHA